MPEVSIKSLSIPITMLSSVLAGSAFIRDTRSDLDHLKEKVQTHPAEVKDIDVYEACQLLSDQVAFIPRIVESLKKS